MKNCDSWVIVEIPNLDEMATGPIYKLLRGMSGGYLDGDSWHINSGITKSKRTVESSGRTLYTITGYSGSSYVVSQGAYSLRMSTAGIANRLTTQGCKILEESEAFELLMTLENV